MFDVLIIGGGVSGVSCALILGSAHKKHLSKIKKSELSLIKNHLRFKMLYLIMLTEFLLVN